MGNYYSGMINNKFGYGELRHARTKGSRNGYSTTPGYVAIGKKAQGPKERESQGRSFSSVFGRIGKWVVDNARKNPKIDVLYRAQQIGKSEAPKVKKFVEDAHRQDVERTAKIRKNSRDLRASTYGHDRYGGMDLRVDTDPETNYWNVNGGWSKDNRKIAQKIADDARKENELFMTYKGLERGVNSMVRQYEGLLKKGKYEEAEELLPRLQKRYDVMHQAELDYREFKNSSNNWKMYQNLDAETYLKKLRSKDAPSIRLDKLFFPDDPIIEKKKR